MFFRPLSCLLLVAALVAPWAGASAQDQPQMDLQRVQIGAGMYQIDAQVAATPLERQIGLMFR